MQVFTRVERAIPLPRRVFLVIILALVLTISGSVFYLLRSASSDQPVSNSLPPGVHCVLAPVVQAPPPPPHAQSSPLQKPICPPGYVPQPDGHVAPKGMPRP